MIRISIFHLLPIFILLITACNSDDNRTVPTAMEFQDLPSPEQVFVEGSASPADGAGTLPPTFTDTAIPASETATATVTVTPSMTITDTPTPEFTPTPFDTSTPGGVLFLAQTARVSTVLPPELRPTLPSATPTQFVAPTIDPTLQTPLGSTSATPATPVPTNCEFQPPGGFGTAFANNPGVAASLGCPVGAPPQTTNLVGASQSFERGSMLYLNTTPGSIYVLRNDGTYIRYDDTYTEGVDPESGELTPPEGLQEPIRGFGKVWRNFDTVQSDLGWATTPEAGGSATIQEFSQGRMIFLTVRGNILVLLNNGTWQSVPGSA